ncbi:AraC-like ligand binding domain-containing protein [Alkalispirochaeta americana]|uniref:AraC-like ligand binding domain-containing protein n=1 Tax=Alkalispirochaeta americana TaxID=159291 RepID=A0A1N6S1J8_9SPIO|nr:helix-turn-helix domain-containing protein [Alkalispirochaeta americana]SIQ35008.1 AraC-like ligand binding domain-containing protein [Alkalispirochaeta americana]
MTLQDIVFVYQMQEPEELRWHGRRHSHGPGQYEMHYFLQGQGRFRLEDEVWQISQGSLFFCRPGQVHSIEATNLEEPLSYYAVLLELDQPGELLQELLEGEGPRWVARQIGTNFRFFFEELRERGLSSQETLRRAAEHQFISFCYLLASPRGEERPLSSQTIHVEKALEVMQRCVSRAVTLEDIARSVGISREHLVRLCQESLGITPMRYLRRLKIEAATSMLVSSRRSVKEISRHLGFSSEFHFSKVFKGITGLAPSRYRRVFRQGLGTPPRGERREEPGG